jgi:hypothetical protein
MIIYKIDVTKIDKTLLYKGDKGTYLSGVLMENKNGRGEYGDDGFIVQNVSKEAHAAGQRGPIIGNWRRLEMKRPAKPNNDEDITF